MSDHGEKGHRSYEDDGHSAGHHESGHRGPQGGLRHVVKSKIKAALGMYGGHESHGSHGEHHGHGHEGHDDGHHSVHGSHEFHGSHGEHHGHGGPEDHGPILEGHGDGHDAVHHSGHGSHGPHGSHGEHHGHGPKKGFLDRVLSRLRRGPSRH